jgi:hypothetical protein
MSEDLTREFVDSIKDIEDEYADAHHDGHSLWITYDQRGIVSLDVCEEPPFSNDGGLLQINLSEFFQSLLYVLEER